MIHIDRLYAAMERMTGNPLVRVDATAWKLGLLWTVAVPGKRELRVCHPNLATVIRKVRTQLKQGSEPCFSTSRFRWWRSSTSSRRPKGKDAHEYETLEQAR